MLEELFSENIVDQPDDIERVIEGVDFDRKEAQDHGSGNEEEKNDDEKAKDKELTKIKRKQGPRIVLNAQRLVGSRGIGVMESFFSDIPEKLQGKGREKEDLDLVMGRMEHWAHRMMPRYQFDDCLKKIESLGSKKIVMNMVKRIRLGMEDDAVLPDEVLQREEMDSPPPDRDPFDELISSSAPTRPIDTDITAEQREQMLRNRLIAEERRAARIKRAQEMKEKFQTQQMAASQTASFQPSVVEITAEESPETGREERDKVEPERNLSSEIEGENKNVVGTGIENSDENREILNYSMTHNNGVRMEVSIENRTPVEENGQPEVPVQVFHSPVEENESRPDEPERNENQLDVMGEDSNNKLDILSERDRNNSSSSNLTQPDILGTGGGVQPDILSADTHESDEISRRNEVAITLRQLDMMRAVWREDPSPIDFNESLDFSELILEDQPQRVGNQPVVMEVNENQLPDVLPDRIENQPDVVMERIENVPDVVMERIENVPDVVMEGIENVPGVVMEGIENVPDILRVQSVNQPDVLN